MASTGETWRLRPWLIALLALAPIAVMRAGLLAESDTFWQIRAGLLMLDTRRLPRVDSFSWTASGDPWTLNSWGFDLLLGVAYRVAGLPGVAVLCAAVVLCIGWLTLVLARRLGAAPSVAGALLVLSSPLFIGWFSARPQLIDYAGTLALVLVLMRGAGWRGLVVVFALAVMWTNLHAGVLLGAACIAAAAVACLVFREHRGRLRWLVPAGVCFGAGSLVNPYGLGIASQSLGVANSSSGSIVEWGRLDLSNPTQAVTFAFGLLALAIAIKRREPIAAGFLAVLAVGSVEAVRVLPILGLAALPVIAAAASAPGVLAYIRSRRVVLAPGAAIAVLALVVVALPSLGHLGQPDPSRYSSRVVAEIPAGCRLFNSFDLGGYVILERPDVPVSLDSRNDLYGLSGVVRADRVLRGKSPLPAESGCVLVGRDSGLARTLRGAQGWRVAASGASSVLFVRG